MFRKPVLLAFASAFAAFAPQPAIAQEEGGEKVNMIIVYGEEACPVTKGDEIIVCARKPEAERYRIPAPFRGGDPNSAINTAWSERARSFETVGQSGINSCTPTTSGASGCMAKLIRDAYAERKQPSDVRFGKAIEAERAKRAATIDATTAAEQARVEAIEKQYDERKAAEEAAKSGQAPAPPPSDLTTPPPGN